jgi:lysophospholipase L1-like esterase
MKRSFKLFSLAVVAAMLAALFCQVLYLGMRFNSAVGLIQDSVAFQRLRPQIRYTVLVVGDGTGVGTGAAKPSESVAGRMGARYACISVLNRARDWAVASDLATQIASTGKSQFDLLLVQVGASDNLTFTDLHELRASLSEAVALAAARTNHVVVMSAGSLGPPPALLPLLGWIYRHRARQVDQVLSETMQVNGVEFVDLSRQTGDAFAKEPTRYYAADGLHPNGAGYRLWYRALIDQSKVKSLLRC